MTLVTAVKDYIEVVHKLIEVSPNYVFQHSNYGDILTILNFCLSSFKQICINIISFEWLKNLWYFPILVPDIASSMISEISVLDGNFHNIITFLDKQILVDNTTNSNVSLPLICFEKLFTGLINSLFLWIPTSTATFICFRRFIMQGIEAGFVAALGTMVANLFWLTSILFGLRFIVVPWMSLDLFRYWLGFLLLMKYFWDNRFPYKEVKHSTVFGKNTLKNIFCFHFLLALTEQTSLYPFLTNFSISAQSTLLEGFSSENFLAFNLIHISYLFGILIGSYSLINLICWFWQDPAYRFYFWLMNKFKKLRIADIVRPVHLLFQSITVAFAFSSLPYFGIEYGLTNPLGFLPNDQTFQQFKETSFLIHPSSPAYYRSRLNFPRQKFFRYEDWAEYYHRNIPLDTSLYDQGAYRLYTMEDLNYGTDYEWIRRRSDKIKIRSRLKRLRWFPRNWANRLWEFTKTWSRRNIAWRNDILNTYQYSWDSKPPIIWGKLVREELFPKFQTNTNLNKKNNAEKIDNANEIQNIETKKLINNNGSYNSIWGPDPDWTSKFLWNQNSSIGLEKNFWWNWQSRRNLQDNNNWWKWINSIESFPKEKSKDNQILILENLYNKTLINNQKENFLRFNTQFKYKSDFWKPQNRLISLYLEKSKQNELTLELSTLRKFTRKLTARFRKSQLENNIKPIQINKNNFDSITLKLLLFFPQLKEWNNFQIAINNINRVLWWSRLTSLVKSNSKKTFIENERNILLNTNELKNQKYSITEIQSISNSRTINLSKKTAISNQITPHESQIQFSKEKKIRKFLNWNNKISSIDNKLNKFTKIQNKFIEIKKNLPNFQISQSEKFETKQSALILKNKTNLNSRNNFLKNENKEIKNLSNIKQFQNTKDNIKLENLTKLNTNNFILLHPLNFYIHKEQNFQKKLNFYGIKNSTNIINNKNNRLNTFQIFEKNLQQQNTKIALPLNFNSETDSLISQKNLANKVNPKNISTNFLKSNQNTLPIFNFYMKTYFQNYKPTRLYTLNTKMKRQLGVSASARRKGRDYTNKLLKRSKILSGTPWIRQWVNQSGFLTRRKRLETWIRRQHYDPNELWSQIMKIDVDSFINRQPSSHFLTNTEEKLLHLRRFLLFEHYDSLRWYKYMTHYRTMKNKIGGTKSFTSRLYNQQFKGTFHKVRHLFSLTPSTSNSSLLKFDQPLYNVENFQIKNSVTNSVANNLNPQNLSIIHEEWDKNLENNYLSEKNFIEKSNSVDLIDESTQQLRNSILQSNNLRQEFINGILVEKNYNQLTSFLISEKKAKETNFVNQTPFLVSNLQNRQNSENFSNLIISTQLKEKLRAKFMISLFRKRQKWTKDYKKTSEKLWKKWKLKILWLNQKNQFVPNSQSFNIPIKNSVEFSNDNSDRPLNNNEIFKMEENEKFLTKNNFNSKMFSNKNPENLELIYPLQKKLSDIVKLKELLKLNQEKKIWPLLNKTNNKESLLNTQNNSIKELDNFSFKDKNFVNFANIEQQNEKWKIPLKTAIRQSLKDAVKIQTKGKSQELAPILFNEPSASLKKYLETKKIEYKNNLVKIDKTITKQLIKNIYKKVLLGSTKNSFEFKDFKEKNKLKNNRETFSLKLLASIHSIKPELYSKKFWNYYLFNQIKKRNQYFSDINWTKKDFNFDFISPNSIKNLNTIKKQNQQSNLIQYQKNFILRERANLQNYILMKKILLNEANSSFTHHQIRPLPSTRGKQLFDKQAISETPFGLKNNQKDLFSNLEPKPFVGSIKSVLPKIHAYKNRKWLELQSFNNASFNVNIENPEIEFKKSNQTKHQLQNLSILQKINTNWSLLLEKVKINLGQTESNIMDQQLQNKLLQNQNFNFDQNNLSFNSTNSNSKLVMTNKLSGVVFTDKTVFSDNIRQKLQKTIQSKTKSVNFVDITNRIKRTKQRRKRQKLSIKRNLLRRHLTRKNRRKLFLKTKEINNQRIVLDRKAEIKERLFLTKIDKLNSSLPQLDTNIKAQSNYSESLNLENRKKQQNFINKTFNSINNDSIFSLNSNERSPINIPSEIPTAGINQLNEITTFEELEKAIKNPKKLDFEFIDNFIIWLLIEKKKENLKETNLVNETFLTKTKETLDNNLLAKLNKIQLKNNLDSEIKVSLHNEKTIQNKFKTWWLNNKSLLNLTKFNETKKENSINQSSQSYLTSLMRSSRFINQLITKNQKNLLSDQGSSRDLVSTYVNFKFKETLNSFNELENEKNRLRRTLRKSIITKPAKTEWSKKLLHSKLHNKKLFLKNNRIIFYGLKNEKNIFLNNIALSTWIKASEKKSKFSFYKKRTSLPLPQENLFSNFSGTEGNTLHLKETINNFPFDPKTNTDFISENLKSSKNIIDLNKYIITARTNPNKLTRQQIRKKIRKRRILRTKRMERLKILNDHPLKFRSEQIQNFYNVQNSLKKWKNFAFISSKLNLNNNIWKNILQNENFFEKKPIILPSNLYENSLNTPFSETRSYKPLNSVNVREKPFVFGDNITFHKQQNYPLNTSYTEAIFNSSQQVLKTANSDLLYKLYSHIFGNSLNFNTSNNIMNQFDIINNQLLNENFAAKKTELNQNSQKFLLNSNPIPFYAGWDETVRKFVITNRLLSRREAGYNINLDSTNTSNLTISNQISAPRLLNPAFSNNSNLNNLEFTSWPLKGKNSATTLFSQFPFMINPHNSLNYSSSEILQLKGGTKYKIKPLNELKTIANNTNVNNFIKNKWMVTSKEELNLKLSENFFQLKNQKRIKNPIKANKTDNQDRLRKYGQVISNVTIPSYRKNRRSALFAPLRWRNKYKTTKLVLNNTTANLRKKSKLKTMKLFKTKVAKNDLVDKKMITKVRLLNTFKPGNRAQTQVSRINRFLTLRRASSSSWKNKISSLRRKKRRIKPIQANLLSDKSLELPIINKLLKEGGWEKTRFIIKKRKKRGNNKNPRLRGDKNIRSIKRQLRQKLYLRPKKRPLRRRSIAVYFQNKLNYWRSQSININSKTKLTLNSNQNSKTNAKNLKQQIGITEKTNLQSLTDFNNSNSNRILFTKNLLENSKYGSNLKEWNYQNRSRQLYRSLFKNPTIIMPDLYENLPGHSRSIPIIKNLPAPGSSVKTLNRVVKWNSADGASRFHRVNLSYGWALQLFLKNLHQKIKFKQQININNFNQNIIDTNNQKTIQNSMTGITNTHETDLKLNLMKASSKFSSFRNFQRRSVKLRQLSYTMSLRLYDRWFFYYYSLKNSPFIKQEQFEKGINLNFNNKLDVSSVNQKRNLFYHLKKFITFHLNENQTSFRAYLKNLRIKAKKQAEKAQPINQNVMEQNNLNFNSLETNELTRLPKNSLYNFKLFSESNNINQKSENLNLKQSNIDLNQTQKTNKTLLKKEKKLQEDRFFFAQFNRPPFIDDSRINRELNRHYPLNGGFVWPGDYLRLKTIQLPKTLIEQKLEFYSKKFSSLNNISLQQKNLNFRNKKTKTLDFNLNSNDLSKKFPTYLDKWNIPELNNSFQNHKIINQIKKEKIRSKINNLKQIFSTD